VGAIGAHVVFTFLELGKELGDPGDPAGADVSDENREVLMGLADKAKDKAEELAGKAKTAAGDATDNPDLEAEGRVQESKADLKQAGENVKDSGDDVADALRAASGAVKGDDSDTTR
jgi:uncharacterized protein YjbJ (UPF0337 family)